jgi:hypothetical protein
MLAWKFERLEPISVCVQVNCLLLGEFNVHRIQARFDFEPFYFSVGAIG